MKAAHTDQLENKKAVLVGPGTAPTRCYIQTKFIPVPPQVGQAWRWARGSPQCTDLPLVEGGGGWGWLACPPSHRRPPLTSLHVRNVIFVEINMLKTSTSVIPCLSFKNKLCDIEIIAH